MLKRLVSVAVLASLIAGCGLRQPLPTFESLAPGVPPGSDLTTSGRLMDNGGCVELVTVDSLPPGIRIALLWEPGWTIARGPLRVYNNDGALAASEGQLVWLGGMNGLGKSQLDPACATPEAFRVTDVMTTDPINPP